MTARKGKVGKNTRTIDKQLNNFWGPATYAMIGGICVLIWAFISGWPGQMSALSYEQERLDTAISAPNPTQSLEFSFTPKHDGLNYIEVVIVNFQPNDPEAVATAVLTLVDESGNVIASRRLQTNFTQHNEKVRLDFDPIKDSNQRSYTLIMTGGEGNGLSMWGYSLNVWPGSELVGGGEAQTLHMKTGYAFQLSSIPDVLSNLFGRFWAVIIVALLYIPLPGAILLMIWPQAYRPQPIVRLGLIVGLGVAIWPLLWQWLTVISFSFSGPILWGILVLGWLLVAGLSWRNHAQNEVGLTFDREVAALVLFLIIVFLLRLLAVRDMAFLPWVDSSRHALITSIMRDSGQFLTTYEPYLPVSWTGYHYGFHTLSAGMGLLLGDSITLPDLLLPLMQILSTLTTLSVFAGAKLITGRSSAGWIAAFMLSLPFLFPGYYTTWGRLTQISGMIVLPLLVGLLMSKSDEAQDTVLSRTFILASALTAGLFLLHARVFFYFIPFGLVLGGYHLVRWVRTTKFTQTNWQTYLKQPLGQLILIAIASAILVLPRIIRLLSETTYVGVGVVTQTADRPLLQFPFGYFTAGWEQWFWTAALMALPLALVNWSLLRNKKAEAQEAQRWLWISAILVGWIALLYLMTAGPSLHRNWPILLPQSSVNSAYIATFATEAILIGISVILLIQLAYHFNQLLGYLSIGFLSAALVASALFGVRNQIVILNQTTVLGQAADLAAIEWIEENTPPNAKIANNSWLWLGQTWAGTDGGAWITPMTGRLTGTPPIDHVYNSRLFGITSAFNQAAQQEQDWSNPASLNLLRQNGFTHIFTGVSDGAGAVDIDPADLLKNPEVELMFSADGVYIFEIINP